VSKLEDFLNSKPLYYSEIDTTRMPRAYSSIQSYFKFSGKTIHLIGTNGKGTTGRYLAKYLYLDGKKVGHYTSPHIIDFSERIWINDRLITKEELDTTHEKLLSILDKEFIDTLSYFEYTTLIAMLFFVSQNVDYIVLEAGLGGEYDATSVFSRDISLLTTVDFDHIDFLGDSLKSITTTKVNSVTNTLIIGHQKNKEVLEYAKDICIKKSLKCFEIDDFITDLDINKINEIKIANYLKNNLKLTISSLKLLGYNSINYSYFNQIEFFGRCQKISDNITIDVGHNILASDEIK
jgi:dihydrofolate synthase/folylpolyglutamate synthase